MTITLHHCSYSADVLNPENQLTVIHGGCGPQDPTGPKARLAADTLATIAEQLHGVATQPLSPERAILKSIAGTLSAAEERSLRGTMALELDPMFNAGIGSALQADGRARVSAGYMESTRGVFSAISNLEDYTYPSELTCLLQHERFSVLDGLGAPLLAERLGLPTHDLVTAPRRKRWEEQNQSNESGKHGTVGAVSIDHTGALCAITSTGGVGNETIGRVGDTPTVAGNYCSQRIAISCTGQGEQIVRQSFATRVATRVDDGMDPVEAMRKTTEEAQAQSFEVGAIAVACSADGQTVYTIASTTRPYFVWAAISPDGVSRFDSAS